MKKRQITIKDIANALNISPSTVSRSLADHPDISLITKERVIEFTKVHGYKPNVLASSLRTSNSKTIGVIIPQIVHYFFSSVLTGIEDEAEKAGYKIFICQSNEIYEKEVKAVQALLETRVCGVLASVAKTSARYEHFQDLIDNDIPMVFFDRICTGILTDRIVVDDYAGSHNAVDYMVKTGCRRIAFFGTLSHLPINNNRRMGYEDALRRNGLPVDPVLMRVCDNYTDALALTPQLLALPEPPDAFFAVNDETAVGILNVAKSLGYKVPDQVSICGFTNSVLSEYCDPMLTSVDQHSYELGATAMQLLLAKITTPFDNHQLASRVIKTQLVVRNTTRPLS